MIELFHLYSYLGSFIHYIGRVSKEMVTIVHHCYRQLYL